MALMIIEKRLDSPGRRAWAGRTGGPLGLNTSLLFHVFSLGKSFTALPVRVRSKNSGNRLTRESKVENRCIPFQGRRYRFGTTPRGTRSADPVLCDSSPAAKRGDLIHLRISKGRRFLSTKNRSRLGPKRPVQWTVRKGIAESMVCTSRTVPISRSPASL